MFSGIYLINGQTRVPMMAYPTRMYQGCGQFRSASAVCLRRKRSAWKALCAAHSSLSERIDRFHTGQSGFCSRMALNSRSKSSFATVKEDLSWMLVDEMLYSTFLLLLSHQLPHRLSHSVPKMRGKSSGDSEHH